MYKKKNNSRVCQIRFVTKTLNIPGESKEGPEFDDGDDDNGEIICMLILKSTDCVIFTLNCIISNSVVPLQV